MSQHRFDDLTRAAAQPGSRRGFLRGLIGAAVATLGLGAFGRDATAQDGCDSFVCPDDYCSPRLTTTGVCDCYQNGIPQICRASGCYTDIECADGALCFASDYCNDGFPGHCIQQCVSPDSLCDEGMNACGGDCVDLQTDLLNCGKCGEPCGGGEMRWGHVPLCVGGICGEGCADDADYCGDFCTDFAWDASNCGGCGNVCDGACCGGRCVDRDDAERFCDSCGMFSGFPQGCNANEVCQNGLCVGGTVAFDIGSWTCDAYPASIFEAIEPPIDAVDQVAWDIPGCRHDDGVTYLLFDADGTQIASCVIANGMCRVDVPSGSVASIEAQGLPEGVIPQGNGTVIVGGLAIVINYAPGADTSSQEATAPTVSATGQLAYAIRDGQHWSIWTHDLVTGDNTLLADEPDSDQFAPAWSHDGTRIAYLSDQSAGVNQVWLMDAAGGNQRQLGDYTGDGNLVHVAWSWDDAAIVATVADAAGTHHMVAVPPNGGQVNAFSDQLGGWPSFATGDRMAFVGESDFGKPILRMQIGSDVRSDVVPEEWLGGDSQVGEPCLALSGTNLALSVGQPGARRVIAFGPYSDRPVPDIPRAGYDNSNPVWSPDETQLAFVAVDASGQSIVIHALDAPGSAPAAIDIPPHDRVWYLSWNQAAEPTPPLAAGSPSIGSATEPPLVPGLTTFTSPGYGWQFSYESIIYSAESPDPETIAISPIGGSRNDWFLTLMTLDASRPSYPVKLNTITEFSVATCTADHDARHGWTISPDAEAPRPHLHSDMVYQQVFLGMRGVWGFAACYEVIPDQAVVVIEGIAYNFDDDDALFDRLDRMLAAFHLPG